MTHYEMMEKKDSGLFQPSVGELYQEMVDIVSKRISSFVFSYLQR